MQSNHFDIRFLAMQVDTTKVGLDQAQLDFLRLLAHFTTEEEVKELNDLVCKYYAQEIDQKMTRLWGGGKWSHEKSEETLKKHLRIPYNVKREKL